MDEQMQQQIVQLVQMAMQGDEQANQQIQQIMQAAKQGDQQAVQIAQMIQQVAQQLQGQQVQTAKFGAKLNYIKYLRNQCPEGYEMQTFRKGGAICKKCIRKKQAGDVMDAPRGNAVDQFKCGRKMKKKACGGSVEKDKCGKKMEMDKCGNKMKKKACGGQVKKNQQGGTLNSLMSVDWSKYGKNLAQSLRK